LGLFARVDGEDGLFEGNIENNEGLKWKK